MRKKLNPSEKRGELIGIKVKAVTKEQLAYIAERDAIKLSSLINTILVDYIENYFKIAKIDWETIPPEEKRSAQVNE